MAQLLSGVLNLSRIPKNLIQTNSKGEKILYIDLAERQSPGQYGDTHYIKVWDKESRQSFYIADLKPRDFGQQNQQSAPAPQYNPRGMQQTGRMPSAPLGEDMPDDLGF